MGQKKTDLRVVRTRKAIRDAFCAMIMEMDYPEITIKELTQRAMINRNTFYLHYGSIDALLRELQDEIAGEFIDKQVSYTKMCDIRRMIRVFFEYMATQSPLHDRLLCSGSYQFLYDRINQQVMGHRKLMNRGPSAWTKHLRISSLPTMAVSPPSSSVSGLQTARSSLWARWWNSPPG